MPLGPGYEKNVHQHSQENAEDCIENDLLLACLPTSKVYHFLLLRSARNVTIQTAPLHRCLTITPPATRVVRE